MSLLISVMSRFSGQHRAEQWYNGIDEEKGTGREGNRETDNVSLCTYLPIYLSPYLPVFLSAQRRYSPDTG